MITKFGIILLMIISLCFFFSCSNKDSSNIQFRIKNNLGEPIDRCYLGVLIRKGYNSYRSTSYKTRWDNIEIDGLTSYKKTKGKFWGYMDCSTNWFGQNSKYPHKTNIHAIEEAIERLDIPLVQDSIWHPYNKKMVHHKRLPDGKYTLTIEGFNDSTAQTIDISIVKDE